jgi:hypothetical protein
MHQPRGGGRALRRHTRPVGLVLALAVAAVVAGLLLHTTGAAASTGDARCTYPNYPATRDSANPLMLNPAPPAPDPLRGADFMVLGPTHGVAAGAIAQLLGQDTQIKLGTALAAFPKTESWARFADHVARALPSEPTSVQTQIELLEKIAAEPSAVRISAYSSGGTPKAIYAQTRELYCNNLRADPGSIPIISTYFLHAVLGGCSSTAQIHAYAPTFKAQINALAQGVARNPAVIVAETDAVGSSACMARKGSLGAWEGLMRYEDLTLEALPHTAVYMEGGYSDSNSVRYAARMLNAAGVRQIQGFFTNDTHQQWTSHELRYARAVSKLTGGAHFIINTATNGRGPLLNPHPRSQGVEELCNPPARGLGIPSTTNPGLGADLDALLWTSAPGNSSGTCHGGPVGGTFWVARAEQMAADANLELGPGSPSQPY